VEIRSRVQEAAAADRPASPQRGERLGSSDRLAGPARLGAAGVCHLALWVGPTALTGRPIAQESSARFGSRGLAPAQSASRVEHMLVSLGAQARSLSSRRRGLLTVAPLVPVLASATRSAQLGLSLV
jgi:hypothetical protein